jgi:hypothetical protein
MASKKTTKKATHRPTSAAKRKAKVTKLFNETFEMKFALNENTQIINCIENLVFEHLDKETRATVTVLARTARALARPFIPADAQ